MNERAFRSEPPVVTLAGVITEPYNLAIATARTCYSSKGIVTREDVTKDEKALALRDKIGSSTLAAGHLTTRQHAQFVFALDRVSRHFIWSFLHSHPYYNSEQVSQRYVKVARGHYHIPALPEKQAGKYIATFDLAMDRYAQLIELLMPDIQRRFFDLFPARAKNGVKYDNTLKKRAYEIARYVLPVATHAYLYHSISGLTLIRYRRLCRIFDTPAEQTYVVDRMIEEVLKVDPNFEKDLKDPMPLEDTPEYAFFESRHLNGNRASAAKAFAAEFDASLEGHVSKLVDYKQNAEAVFAQSVRSTLGATRDALSDADAIDLVMNPEKNRYFGDTLNVTTLSKLTRAMVHPHYTFRKKISHTADSQDQRHRMTPGSRPILWAHYSGEPDFIEPMLVKENAQVREIFADSMRKLFGTINELLNDGVTPENALYLLPNAFPIRFEESGDLLNQHHKWKARSCYTAQEEIFFATIDELKQVNEIHPRIARHILAPCYLRKLSGEKPYCPEGDRYCGVPVWKKGIEGYGRTL
ncbi:MAG TPA: FAD-dependent thymidylate synthase [bacterium]|nr:FAD-dependent thymidylate synthase [bacterium]